MRSGDEREPFGSAGATERDHEAGRRVCGFGILPRLPRAFPRALGDLTARAGNAALQPRLRTPGAFPQPTAVTIGTRAYRALVGPDAGVVRETSGGGEKTYPIVHVLGGKNAYYFLTPLDKGRLQVLPVAYDVPKKTWYDTAASGVRHFPDRTDSALDWTDRMFTFNTTCFNCHVSQLATNYDLASDTYRTTWAEAGISCESCHGPAAGHVRVMSEGKAPGHTSKDIQIIRTKEFTSGQLNDMCATCHAKMVPISTSFRPGDAFFDHYDLVTLDHPDYYPDGRDLGENYTFTSWLKSPCVVPGKLDCNQCHTGSGRPRFEKAESNRSCLPCHKKLVDEPVTHGHHAAGSTANLCVSCHMPTTRFAAMGRTDHSMLPPTPAATRAFQSPNACNLCHADKDAAWADERVPRVVQARLPAPVLNLAGLLDAARHRQAGTSFRLCSPHWTHRRPTRYGRHRCSLCSRERPTRRSGPSSSRPSAIRRRWSVPGRRQHSPGSYRWKRCPRCLPPRATARDWCASGPPSLSRLTPGDSARRPRQGGPRGGRRRVPHSHERPARRLGFTRQSRQLPHGARDFARAVNEFETATKLEPRVVGPLVNASLAYSNLNQPDRAEASLRRALAVEPNNASALFNLGLLLAETGRTADAVKSLRAAPPVRPAHGRRGLQPWRHRGDKQQGRGRPLVPEGLQHRARIGKICPRTRLLPAREWRPHKPPPPL